ncbi:hypothetical protein ACJ73_04520 [Blastomyces percursus]|uniref:Uncharacterized protein n=1 Tax=Blastomyces percursus TaxID=1658174 RepID=A0A1J9R902_9EURO|nr:hypothetical protein ACJ73_04520 [Blastomyces percursus]
MPPMFLHGTVNARYCLSAGRNPAAQAVCPGLTNRRYCPIHRGARGTQSTVLRVSTRESRIQRWPSSHHALASQAGEDDTYHISGGDAAVMRRLPVLSLFCTLTHRGMKLSKANAAKRTPLKTSGHVMVESKIEIDSAARNGFSETVVMMAAAAAVVLGPPERLPTSNTRHSTVRENIVKLSLGVSRTTGSLIALIRGFNFSR